MQTYKTQIIRKIFDGRDFKSSKVMASTMIEIELPFAPFQGLQIAIIYPEEIKSVLWKPTGRVGECGLELLREGSGVFGLHVFVHRPPSQTRRLTA